MLLSSTIACVLIFAGAAIMLKNIIDHRILTTAIRRSTEGFSKRTTSLIHTHMTFMVFFFISYLGVAYLLILQADIISSIFVGVVFFFGAIFVYIGIAIQRSAFELLNNSNEELRTYSRTLEDNQAMLTCLNETLKKEILQKEKAQESEQLKTDFLSQVSHELRTPLTSIFGFAKLIKKDFDVVTATDVIPESLVGKYKRIDKNISIISMECSRLTRMINNVLDLAKIESGQGNWNDEIVPFDLIIQSSVSAVEGLVHEKPSVVLITKTPERLPAINVDVDLFTQVLVNILCNAIKFTEHGEIVIEAAAQENELLITVRDQGIGIAAENLSKIFDKYFIARSGNTLSSSKLGTGLGLPICKQIVEHYHGKIWVESELGHGSRFFISIPLC